MPFQQITRESEAYPKGRILLLTSLPPYPARSNGFSIRYAPIIDALKTTHVIELALVTNGKISDSEREILSEKFSRVVYIERESLRQPLLKRVAARLLSLFPGTLPYPLVAHDAKELEAALKESFRGETFDVLLSTLPNFTHMAKRAIKSTRMIVDSIDSMSLLARRSVGRSIVRWFDAGRMMAWERSLSRVADYVVYIADNDRVAAYPHRDVPRNVGVIPNGTFCADYETGDAIATSPFEMLFLGNMAYGPNVDAALRLARVLPLVQREVPDASLTIVGRDPSAEVLSLKGLNGVHITGTVESIWPYLHRAAVCCFPMTSGAGMQNKVLESMWAACPVVTTDIGNSGIRATHGVDVLIANSDKELSDALVFLMKSPAEAQRIGRAGRAFVERNFSWERSIEMLRRAIDGDIQ